MEFFLQNCDVEKICKLILTAAKFKYFDTCNSRGPTEEVVRKDHATTYRPPSQKDGSQGAGFLLVSMNRKLKGLLISVTRKPHSSMS